MIITIAILQMMIIIIIIIIIIIMKVTAMIKAIMTIVMIL